MQHPDHAKPDTMPQNLERMACAQSAQQASSAVTQQQNPMTVSVPIAQKEHQLHWLRSLPVILGTIASIIGMVVLRHAVSMENTSTKLTVLVNLAQRGQHANSEVLRRR